MGDKSITAVFVPQDGKWHALSPDNKITDYIVNPSDSGSTVGVFDLATKKMTQVPVQIDKFYQLNDQNQLVEMATQGGIPWNSIPGASTASGMANSIPGASGMTNRLFSKVTPRNSTQNSAAPNSNTNTYTVPDQYKLDSQGIMRDLNGKQVAAPAGTATELAPNVFQSQDGAVWVHDKGNVLRFKNMEDANVFASSESMPLLSKQAPNGQRLIADMSVADAKGNLVASMNHLSDGRIAVFDAKTNKTTYFDNEEAAKAAYNKVQGGKGASPLDKLMNSRPFQIGTAALTGYGLYTGFLAMSNEFSAGALVGTATSSLFFMQSVSRMLMGPEGLAMSAAKANGIALAIVGGIALAAILWSKFGPKKDNPLDTTSGDVSDITGTTKPTGTTTAAKNASPSPNYPNWYQMLPSQSVFTILGGVTALAIGINLAVGGPSMQSVSFNTPQLAGVRSQLSTATGKAVPEGIIGKVFIKKGDGTTVPDKVVYVTQEGENDYKVNMVSLNTGGYLLSDTGPMAMTPFFLLEPRSGAVIPNPPARSALATQTAMAQYAASGVASPGSASTAVTIGVAQGHRVAHAARRQ